MSKGLRLGKSTTTTSWEGSGCKPGPLLLQAPSTTWENRGPGTLRGLRGDSRPPRKSGPPRALEIPRAPRNAARLPGNLEKNFCFFFSLFWHSRSPGARLPAPTWGSPPRSAPPLFHRQPIAFVGSPVGGAGGGKGHALRAQVFKRRRRARRDQIADAEDSSHRSAKPWTIPAEDFAVSPSSFVGRVSLSSERSGSVGRFWALRPRSLHFLPRDCRGLFSTVDYNCNMTLEELVACDNAAQK